MIKKRIVNIIDMLEFLKIICLQKILGENYLLKSLYLCRKANVSKILKFYGAKVGIENNIKTMLTIDNYGNDLNNLCIKNNCYIGKKVFFDLVNKITIDNDVVISAGVTIMTHADVGDRLMKKNYHRISEPVHIGKGTWIGTNSIILAGVTIGENCVIAAGSVVTKSIPSNKMVAGIPAIIKKELFQQ